MEFDDVRLGKLLETTARRPQGECVPRVRLQPKKLRRSESPEGKFLGQPALSYSARISLRMWANTLWNGNSTRSQSA